MDYYAVLEVDKNATEDQIKHAFRQKAKQYHPDVCKENNAEDKFKQINEAYEVLSDPQKRSNYDNFGDPKGHPGFGQDAGFGGFSGFGGFNPGSIFEEFFNHQQRQIFNSNINIEISLTPYEFIHGCVKNIIYSKTVFCSKCNGEGGFEPIACKSCMGRGFQMKIIQQGPFTMQQQFPCNVCNSKGKKFSSNCPNCNGKGQCVTQEKFDLNIPENIPLYATVQIPERGNQEHLNFVSGNLNVTLNINCPQNFFVEDNGTINYIKDISIDEWKDNKDIVFDRFGVENIRFNLKNLNSSTEKIIFKQKGLKSIRGQGDFVVSFKIHK